MRCALLGLAITAIVGVYTFTIVTMLASSVRISSLQARLENFTVHLNKSYGVLRVHSKDFSSNQSGLQMESTMLLRVLAEPTASPLTSPCILLPTNSSSGYYWTSTVNGSAMRVYCNMTLSCGGVTGGWMRVAELNMSNSDEQCPRGLQMRVFNDIRTCVRRRINGSQGCSTVEYGTFTRQYSKVCGKVIGYQYGFTSAFAVFSRKITHPYVEGVSITYGDPRRHIWTFAAGLDEESALNYARYRCPCNRLHARRTVKPPHFVRHNYFCDTADRKYVAIDSRWNKELHKNDPLWDGNGCGPNNGCCTYNNPPWFYRDLGKNISDSIKLSVCGIRNYRSSDVALSTIDIVVQ